MTPTIQCTCIGNFGRFGNQLFQYAFARSYAEKYNAVLEVPPWIGERVFEDVFHPSPSVELPKTELDQIPFGELNINLFGYFQNKECYRIMNADSIREWFTIKDEFKAAYSEYSDSVVAHLRKGDYATKYKNIYHVIQELDFFNACAQHNIDASKLVLLSEENPTRDENVSTIRYSNSPGLYGKSFYPDNGVSFLPDFLKMIHAKTLLRSNSTFSFWAGFLRNDSNVYSPVVKGVPLDGSVSFVKGNAPALRNDKDDIIFGDSK